MDKGRFRFTNRAKSLEEAKRRIFEACVASYFWKLYYEQCEEMERKGTELIDNRIIHLN